MVISEETTFTMAKKWKYKNILWKMKIYFISHDYFTTVEGLWGEQHNNFQYDFLAVSVHTHSRPE